MNDTPHRPWYEGLSVVAKRIAEINHSPLRVLAGPGTGKTFAVMRRVARLLQTGTVPESILVCTFTRTAAQDLRKELGRLGVEETEKVHAGTLHAFCFGLLSRRGVLEVTGRVPRPLLEFEERFLLQDLNGDGFGGIRDRKKRLDAFNAAWARLQSEEPGWPLDPVDRAFQRTLTGWLRFHEAMLIGELVPETLSYLHNNPISPELNVFCHVLVDEFQDLNRAEQELVDLLAGSGTLTIAGDEDQSIYSFKYAHPDGISTFNQSHPEVHDESLTECRRCPHVIVEMANALISNNASRTSRELRASPGNPRGEVEVVQWLSMEEETQGIAQLIAGRIRSKEVPVGEVLVLAPRRQMGYAIRDTLDGLGVPAHSFFHEEALEGNPTDFSKCTAQQAFTLLTLLANPEDRVALRCWGGFGHASLQTEAWAQVQAYCEASGATPRAALTRMASGDITLLHTGGLVRRYQELLAQIKQMKCLQGQSLVDALFRPKEAWASPFRTLASGVGTSEFDVAELREALRVGITQPELPTDVDYVRVMSLHKSKGLTADLVVVVGCIGGLIPCVDKDLPIAQKDRALEEQRRLFYVAITRTTRALILSSITQLPRQVAYKMRVPVRTGNRDYANTIASQFLSELGPALPKAKSGNSVLRSVAL